MTDHDISKLIAEAHAARAEYMRSAIARLFRRPVHGAVQGAAPSHS